jgi:ribose transport system ATP-binding protein
MEREPLLVATSLAKAYAVPVLQNVSLDLRPGEVHAIVGENGAGKSTLARIVAGVTQPDAGTLRLRGRGYAPASRREAREAGVEIVLQELNLVETLSVAENLFLSELPNRGGVVRRARLREDARAALARVGLATLDPDRPVAALGLGQRQLVEIAAALARRADVLVLDEPTAALNTHEAEALFVQVDRLRAEGAGLFFISHRLADVERLADRVTVLRDGSLVATRRRGDVERDEIVRLMVGREVVALPSRDADRPHEAPGGAGPTLRIEGFTGQGFSDVAFEVRPGEILGLAGLVGAGRTELLRAIFGADRRRAGKLYRGGQAREARIDSPGDAVREGLAFVTEDRKAEGLLLPLSVRANVTLAALARLAGGWGRIPEDREERLATTFTAQLGVKARSIAQPVVELSGGNQQKVVLARWLGIGADVLLVDEPTRGIDVGARAEVHRLLLAEAAAGKAIVVASSDLDELFLLSDRILVMAAGRVAAEFERGAFAADVVMAAALAGPPATVDAGQPAAETAR